MLARDTGLPSDLLHLYNDMCNDAQFDYNRLWKNMVLGNYAYTFVQVEQDLHISESCRCVFDDFLLVDKVQVHY